jgi:hypothetical protein
MWSWDQTLVKSIYFFCFMQLSCCFTLYKELLYQSCVFFKIYCSTSLYGFIVSSASADPTSQDHSSARLVLMIVGN